MTIALRNNGDSVSSPENNPQPQPVKLLYDRKSAAYVLSISVRSLDYLISQKRLATIRLGRKVMIGHGALVQFTRANHFTLTGSEGNLA
jgi:hypothetical protein